MNRQIATEVNGLLHEFYSLQDEMNKPNATQDWANNPLRLKEQELMEKLRKFDESLGEGMKPGRHLQFQVGDGYAHYIIVQVNRETVQVVHIPYGDNYSFGGVGVDKKGNAIIFKNVVEANIRFNDFWRKKVKESKGWTA